MAKHMTIEFPNSRRYESQRGCANIRVSQNFQPLKQQAKSIYAKKTRVCLPATHEEGQDGAAGCQESAG